ncbi:MAG: hypothetical protein WDN03_04470 [Rhizomicrobium sp.]
MTAVDFSAHAVNPTAAGQAAGAASAAASPDQGGISFDDIVDIVNPLQHLPVIGTLYRAMTGDTIKTFPKIAGDALYGGVMGLAGSVADTVFEKVTGHNLGDTVLAAVERMFAPDAPATGLASNAPSDTAAAPAASDAPQLAAPAVVADASLEGLVIPGQEALISALHRNGVAPDVAARATLAYRRAVGVAHGASDTAMGAPALRTSIAR